VKGTELKFKGKCRKVRLIIQAILFLAENSTYQVMSERLFQTYSETKIMTENQDAVRD
jgi:hypothetical protein